MLSASSRAGALGWHGAHELVVHDLHLEIQVSAETGPSLGGGQHGDVHVPHLHTLRNQLDHRNLLAGLLQARLLQGEPFSGQSVLGNCVGLSPSCVVEERAPVVAGEDIDFELGGAQLEDGLAVEAGRERFDQSLDADEGHGALGIPEGKLVVAPQALHCLPVGDGLPCCFSRRGATLMVTFVMGLRWRPYRGQNFMV